MRGLIATLSVLATAFEPLGISAATKVDIRDAFFTNNTVWRLKIDLDQKAVASLKEDSHRYVTAAVTEAGTVYRDVGLHLKGNQGSFQPLNQKPSLTLNFDKFVRDQKFRGLDKLYLNNSAQDPTYMCEYIGSDLFRAAGIPAARVSYARVELNGRDLGLYVLVEGYDKSFLKRHFKNAKGNLYDSGFLQDITEPLEITTGDGPQDRSDLKALIEAARENDPVKRLTRLESILDLERFYSYIALEIMASSIDGYAWKKNNYRLYHNPDDGRFMFIPSGMDQLFAYPQSPLLADCSGLLAAAILYTTEARQRYRKRCAILMTNLFVPNRITNIMQLQHERLRPLLAEISGDAARQHDGSVDKLRGRVLARIRHLREELTLPAPITFDSNGAAAVHGWRPHITIGEAQLTNTATMLVIKCAGGHAPSISSWRTRVTLPKGRYRFEAKVKADGLVPIRGAPGGGVLLRVFAKGSSPPTTVLPNCEWRQLACEFVVGEEQAEEELICEARGFRGVMAFEHPLKILKLVGQ